MSRAFGGDLAVQTFRATEPELVLSCERPSTDGSAIVRSGDWTVAFHGYLTNREFLQTNLGLSSAAPDAELLLRSFSRDAKWAVEHLEGLYCAALWDSATRALHLLTDSIGGAYGFYYAMASNGFFFSTRLAALTAIDGIPRQVDRNALGELFSTGYVLPPKTLLAAVAKTWPGELITYHAGHVRREMSAPPLLARPQSARDGTAEQFETALQAAVIKRADLSPTKPGWLLSGGIDSSTLVAMASQHSAEPIKTFSASFPGTEFDESDYARIVAEKYNCDSHFVDMSSPAALDHLTRIVWELDEPFLDYSAVPTYQLFREVRDHVDAVVSGDGPDHLLARYYPLAAKCSLRRWSRLLKLAELLTSHPSLSKFALISGSDIPTAYRTLFTYPAWGNRPVIWKNLFCNPQLLGEPLLDPKLGIETETSADFETVLARLIRVDSLIDGSFGVFLKVGKMARANRLAIHWPYLDPGLIRAAHSLPRHLMVLGGFVDLLRSRSRAKHVLTREIAPKYLPREVLAKTKGGFTPPMAAWLRDFAAKRSGTSFLSANLRDAGLFQLPFIERILAEHLNGTREWTQVLFLLLSFDLWFNMFVARSTIDPPQDDLQFGTES